jgi:hypothetical protein
MGTIAFEGEAPFSLPVAQGAIAVERDGIVEVIFYVAGRPVLGCSLPGPRPVAHRRAQGGMVKCPAGRGTISGAAKRSRSRVPDLTRSAGINLNERLLLRGRKDRLR